MRGDKGRFRRWVDFFYDNLMKRLLYYLYYISCVDDFDKKIKGLLFYRELEAKFEVM